MRIVSVVGTRPQLIKAAALQPALRARHQEVFVDTGQHWDDDMAGAFFRELSLAKPDVSLGAGGGSHAEQTAAMLRGLEPILAGERPDAVLVFGDTNTTLAGALAGSKLEIPVAHIEAGLRSFDRRMPEEINRVVADHLSTWLFAPTPVAVQHLDREGITDGVELVGDLMQDLAARVLGEVKAPSVLNEIAARLSAAGASIDLRPGRYVFATIHRQENRSREAVEEWAGLLRDTASPERRVVLALHPGTRAVLGETALGPDVSIVGPQGYRTSLALQLHAAAVITDSGGIQREAAWLGVPCLVLRSVTEWTDLATTPAGTLLVGRDRERARAALNRLSPVGRSAELAATRAAAVRIEPAGAAEAIATSLERGPSPAVSG
ncbi:MAG TPA: UDP-N-acetylglucosamine 2-epimerase (non-hydrolyzing) [Candidatus Limnocylindrales bacterium]|nr:UDP-N-acetylglucosamine 2-epimerase (non-hydrolyzing) [Candidatus Limnocylindrales bacterium]